MVVRSFRARNATKVKQDFQRKMWAVFVRTSDEIQWREKQLSSKNFNNVWCSPPVDGHHACQLREPATLRQWWIFVFNLWCGARENCPQRQSQIFRWDRKMFSKLRAYRWKAYAPCSRASNAPKLSFSHFWSTMEASLQSIHATPDKLASVLGALPQIILLKTSKEEKVKSDPVNWFL